MSIDNGSSYPITIKYELSDKDQQVADTITLEPRTKQKIAKLIDVGDEGLFNLSVLAGANGAAPETPLGIFLLQPIDGPTTCYVSIHDGTNAREVTGATACVKD